MRNSTDLNENSNEQPKIKRNLFFIGIISVAIGVVVHLLRKLSGIPPKPPPIIIKSGIFVIEADENLVETASESLTETVAAPNTYKRTNFGTIKGVRVFNTNEESGKAESHDYEDRNGIEVDIRLQRRTPRGWEDVEPLVTIRAADNGASSKDFVLTIGKKLKKKGFPNPLRRERWEDDGTEDLRFGRVVVRENDGGGDTFNYDEGDHFLISFYNRLE